MQNCTAKAAIKLKLINRPGVLHRIRVITFSRATETQIIFCQSEYESGIFFGCWSVCLWVCVPGRCTTHGHRIYHQCPPHNLPRVKIISGSRPQTKQLHCWRTGVHISATSSGNLTPDRCSRPGDCCVGWHGLAAHCAAVLT